MDTNPVHDLCSHLVGSQIFFFLLQAKIIPHYIFCLEQIFIIQILHCQSHSRQMVSIHNQNHILRIISQLVCEILYKIIHLMDFIHIVFPLIIFLFRRRTGNRDLRVLQNLLIRISTMALNGNRIHIIRSFCGIQAFQDFICKNCILHPSIGVFLIFPRHILLGSKSIKPQIWENRPSAIEVCLIIVYCMGAIPQILQHIRGALTGCLSQNTLIGILTGAKIMHTHTGDGLKLCICSSRPYRRNLIISGRIVLHQLPEGRDRILRNIQILHQGRIKEGFQLEEKNIRFFLFLSLRQVLLCFLDPFDLILRIIPWTTDSCVKDRSCQTVGISIILICKGNVSKIVGKHPLLQCQLCASCKKSCSHKDQRNIITVLYLVLILRSFDKKNQK